MSTVKTNTLSNVAGDKSVPVDTVVQGSAKAWVNFDGTGTVAIRAAFNVSNITDNGTGDYTVNFTTAMPDTDYAVSGSGSVDATSPAVMSPVSTATYLTTSVRVGVYNNAGTAVDRVRLSVAIFR